MKNIVHILILGILLGSCNRTTPPENQETVKPLATMPAIKQNRLEIYCFHGTRQCETCKNMKANTAEALKRYFAGQLKDSSIIFSIVDVDDDKNAILAEKFQATGTALMINKVVNGRDSIADWSDFAFEKANDQEAYITELKKMLEEALK